jgi:hypothetical protein
LGFVLFCILSDDLPVAPPMWAGCDSDQGRHPKAFMESE